MVDLLPCGGIFLVSCLRTDACLLAMDLLPAFGGMETEPCGVHEIKKASGVAGRGFASLGWAAYFFISSFISSFPILTETTWTSFLAGSA